MNNHLTVGIYPNGSYKHNVVAPEHLESHIDYNITMRPGRLFFVDGVCMNTGWFSQEDINKYQQLALGLKVNMSEVTMPYV